MKNIFTSIKMFLILLLLPSYSLHAQAVTYPVSKPGIPDQPYIISYSGDAMEPFSNAAPSDNSPVAPAPRRSDVSIGDDLANGGMGYGDDPDQGADASPIGAPWILLLLAVGYAAFKFYRKRGLVLETENESNTKNTTIMKNHNHKIFSSFNGNLMGALWESDGSLVVRSADGRATDSRRTCDGHVTDNGRTSDGHVTDMCVTSMGGVKFAKFAKFAEFAKIYFARVAAVLLMLVTMSVGQVWCADGYSLAGTIPGCNWGDDKKFAGSGPYTTTITLTAGQTGPYDFKVKPQGSSWEGSYGKSAIDFSRSNNSGELSTSGGNASFTPDGAGDYIFTFNNGTLTITYPEKTYQLLYSTTASFTSGTEVNMVHDDVNDLYYYDLSGLTEGTTYYFRYRIDGNEYSAGYNASGEGGGYIVEVNGSKVAATQDLSSWGTKHSLYMEATSATVHRFYLDLNDNKNTWITASVAPVSHTLTVSASAGGSITTPAGGSYEDISGQAYSIAASANSGYFFKNWTKVSGTTATFANANAASTTVTVSGSENVEVRANFVQVGTPSNKYYLNDEVGGGKYGTSGTVLNWVDADHVSVDVVLNTLKDYSLQFYIDKNVYKKGKNKITRANNSTDLEAANSSASKITVDQAGTYTFTYTISTGILSVTYPGVVTHTVTINNGDHGTVDPSGNQSVGASGITITATPDVGYAFDRWTTTDGAAVADPTAASTRLTATADGTVTANYAPVQYSVTYDACSSGHGSVAGTKTSGSKLNPGTEVTLTATPDEGYYLRGWYSDAAGNTLLAYAKKTDEYKYVVTLNANKTVYAKFEAIPTGLRLDGNLCGRSWGNCMDASTYSGGVYTWTWTSVTNADKEFCIKNSTCYKEAVVKPNTAGVTFDGTNCTIVDGGDSNHNFRITHAAGDLTVTLTYGSGIYVNATKAADDLATGWYLAGSMNDWSNNNASYQFKLDPGHTDETIGYLTLPLNSNVDFKISNGTTQFANKEGEDNSGTMTVDNCTDWTFDKTSVSGNHTTLRTNGEGDYTFVLNYSTKKVSVIYPNNRYIKSSWNNSWGTAAKMTYNEGTYTIQYKSVPASSNHQFVFCYADKGDMYHADASDVDMSHSTTTLSDGSDHNFTFATTQTGDITITLTESGGTKDVRVAFSGKDISNLTVEVYHNYDGTNWTSRTLTKNEGDNYVQTAPFYSTMYYQLRVDGATIVNQPASKLPGAGECIDGENAKWVYNPHTEILSVEPLGSRHTIYFQNTVEWDDVFVYFYSGSYWDDAKGSGAKSGGNYLGVHQMTHVGDGLYSYTFTGTLPTEVCFAKVNQDTYEFFDDNECAYAGAFAEAKNLYTPNPENPVSKNVYDDGHYSLYYSGEWGTPTEYQVVVTMNNHIEYTSNKVMCTGKTVSFFAPQDGDDTYAGGTVELRANGVKVGEYITGFAAAGVYVATVNSTGDGLVDIAPYTGDYYVRSACVGGDGLMTFFERRATETYSYYKCLFTGDGKTVDVKATVANDYNENLSTMIGVDKFTTAQGQVREGNVRYSYEPTTNDFRRAVIGGSTKNNKFLNVVGDHIYKEEGLTTLLNQAHYNSTPEDSKFDDISDWVYEKTTYVDITKLEDASDVVVMSLFNSQTDYLLGYEKDPVTGYDTDNPRQLTVVGKNSTPGVYKIRIIYDYKRNRLLSAWSPDDITIDSNLQINADVMFVRHEDEDAAQITIKHGSDATVSSLKSVMFVLEMENDHTNSANYWLSLPYDCQISDIFGVDGYGTLWAIQRYDGETRSHGWYAHDTETFWTWMDRDEVLHAGEGYVLTFVKKNAHWSNVKIDGVDRSILRLYFPSQQVGFTMSEAQGSALTKTFEPMICDLIVRDAEGKIVERGDRRAVDSNWRLIGPMSYNNITIASYAASGDAVGHWYNMPPQFLYEYKGKSALAHQRYNVTTTVGYEYHSFHSYMTQYAGTITWVPYTQAVSSVAARRVESEGFTHTNMCLNLIQNDTVVLDRTYVSLDQHATTGYDQNLDLTKITDSKRSQIYSVSGDAYAGNTLPLETDTVALTINAAAAGDYVISMPEQNNDVEPMLYDAEMDMTTPLNMSDYTITLSKGTHADRFYLILGHKTPGVATNIENVTPEELNLPTNLTQKLLINGEVYILRDGHIYDATGRRVR